MKELRAEIREFTHDKLAKGVYMDSSSETTTAKGPCVAPRSVIVIRYLPELKEDNYVWS
jgi:hypothetical protein